VTAVTAAVSARVAALGRRMRDVLGATTAPVCGGVFLVELDVGGKSEVTVPDLVERLAFGMV